MANSFGTDDMIAGEYTKSRKPKINPNRNKTIKNIMNSDSKKSKKITLKPTSKSNWD